MKFFIEVQGDYCNHRSSAEDQKETEVEFVERTITLAGEAARALKEDVHITFTKGVRHYLPDEEDFLTKVQIEAPRSFAPRVLSEIAVRLTAYTAANFYCRSCPENTEARCIISFRDDTPSQIYSSTQSIAFRE